MHCIKMDLEDREDRIHHLAQYRVVAGSCKHCSESLRAIKLANFLTIRETNNFSRVMVHGVT